MKHSIGKHVSVFFKTSLLVFAILLTIFISELIYIVNNRPRLLETFYIWKAQQAAENNIKKALDFIITGSNKYSRSKLDENNPYPDHYKIKKMDIDINNSLDEELKLYFKNPKMRTQYEQRFYDYSRILYELALTSYRHNNIQLFIVLMQQIIITDIGASYWAVELANYYYSINQLAKANNILDNCIKIHLAQLHCNEFKTHIEKGGDPFIVGFLEEPTELLYNPDGEIY